MAETNIDWKEKAAQYSSMAIRNGDQADALEADNERLRAEVAAYERLIRGMKQMIKSFEGCSVIGRWKPVKAEKPDFKCRNCGSDDVWYRTWDSSCGGYADLKYTCWGCDRTWWVEGPDA